MLFTVLTQIRINITNIYSSSLSLSNFFENMFCFKPGRRFWVVVGAVIAMILMLGGIVNHLGMAMTFQGVALMSWAAILVTDALVLKKWLKIGPGYYESRQSNLYKWNPVGVISLTIPTVIGTIAALGYMGTFLQSTAAILTVILGIATKGRYYMRKEAHDIPKEDWIA